MKKISLVALSLVAALAFVGCAKKNNVVINSAEDLQGLKIIFPAVLSATVKCRL